MTMSAPQTDFCDDLCELWSLVRCVAWAVDPLRYSAYKIFQKTSSTANHKFHRETTWLIVSPRQLILRPNLQSWCDKTWYPRVIDWNGQHSIDGYTYGSEGQVCKCAQQRWADIIFQLLAAIFRGLGFCVVRRADSGNAGLSASLYNAVKEALVVTTQMMNCKLRRNIM